MTKQKKQIKGLLSAGLTTGTGALVITNVGGDPRAMTTMSSFYPTIGTMYGGSWAMSELKKMNKKKKR